MASQGSEPYDPAAVIRVDTTSFFLIVLSATIAASIVAALPARVGAPVVVLELLAGIAIGPHGFGWAGTDEFIEFFSNLGLGMLFVDSLVYVGSAMATTAIGTLIPILRDGGELDTTFGTYLLGAGAAGEFGPIFLVTLFLSTDHPVEEAGILIVFTDTEESRRKVGRRVETRTVLPPLKAHADLIDPIGFEDFRAGPAAEVGDFDILLEAKGSVSPRDAQGSREDGGGAGSMRVSAQGAGSVRVLPRRSAGRVGKAWERLRERHEAGVVRVDSCGVTNT
jgi:hypothetical protein